MYLNLQMEISDTTINTTQIQHKIGRLVNNLFDMNTNTYDTTRWHEKMGRKGLESVNLQKDIDNRSILWSMR